jgi:hypothetical protein
MQKVNGRWMPLARRAKNGGFLGITSKCSLSTSLLFLNWLVFILISYGTPYKSHICPWLPFPYIIDNDFVMRLTNQRPCITYLFCIVLQRY